MRIALIGGGMLSVPPSGWGAVEVLLAGYREYLERAGHTIDIYNSVWFNETIVALQDTPYDFIHLHHDMFCGAFSRHLRKPFCVTSHYGGFGRYAIDEDDREYGMLFADTLEAPGNIVFSEPIRALYQRHGYSGFLRVVQNPVDVARFSFHESGNGRAICLGRIQPRKRQATLAGAARDLVALDFVGPHDPAEEPAFSAGGSCRYLGAWDRQSVYRRLTEYSCLVLLSRSEGDPLVVKEAMAAGLSVVVTASSRGTLGDLEFVTVLEDGEEDPAAIAGAIHSAIAGNLRWRSQIRDYALRTFDLGVVMPDYLRAIEEFRSLDPHKR